MLYLKNTLGGLSRSLTDSALSTFQGPHRWWKLALFAVLFVLPGGSVGVAVLAWAEHRRARKGANKAKGDLLAAPLLTVNTAVATAATDKHAGAVGACQSRGDAPCRAAAGKQLRQGKSTESRV